MELAWIRMLVLASNSVSKLVLVPVIVVLPEAKLIVPVRLAV